MGIITGRPVDKYVLRLNGDTNYIDPHSSYKPSNRKASGNSTSNPSQSSKRHQKNVQTMQVVPLTTNEEEHNPNGKNADKIQTGKENYSYGQQSRSASARHMIKQSSTLADSGKNTAPPGASSKLTKKQMSSTNMPLLRQTTQPLAHQASFIAGSTSHKSAPLLQCSATYPWLIKNCSLPPHTNNFMNDYEPGRIIGRGLMGTVRIMKFKNQEKYFVLKSIRKDYVIRHNDMRHITNEKNILYALHSHPFIVNIFGTFQDKQNVYFALQYVPGGELYKKLMKSKRFSPQVSKFYVTEIVAALAHIHRMGYVFRDLKPENVLIDEEGHCKLVDFGFAIKCGGRKLDNGEEEKMHTLCGTPAYLSPEQLDGKLTNGYTRVVDWWSVGVLTYELLTGRTPFCHSPSESHYEIFLRIISATHINFPFDFSSDAKQLVSQLCHVQLSKRLTDVDEILRHPYFVLDWAAVERRDIVPPHVPRLKDIGDVHYFDQYGDSSGTAVNSHNNNTTGGAEAAPVADFFDF